MLDIITVLAGSEQFCRKMGQCSSNLIAELIRMMIEPAKTHAAHEEYSKLQRRLWMIAHEL